MSEKGGERNVEARAELFNALGHPVRLLILNLVQMKPRHGQELAEILRLNPGTISHHLSKLAEVGLLTSEKAQYYQVYSLASDVLNRTIGEVVFMPQSGLSARVEEDAFRDKVLQTFFRRGRLRGIPAQLKKRQIVIERLAEEFEPGRAYTEREVNQVLVEFHDDVATLRRGLIEHKLVERDHGVYRRLPDKR
jgi:hypothetical protein